MVLKNTGLFFCCFLISFVPSERAEGVGCLGRGLLLLALLGEEHRVDVGEDTSRGNGHSSKELAELLVVADGKLDVAGDDAVLLVVAGSVTSKLKDLSSKVLEDSSEVHGGT